jgi:DNA-binding PadR family transcriptional regulator
MNTAEPQRELFVLGLLRREATSAYSIDKAIREHSPLYRSFKRGNLYHLVDRLAKAGLLERARAHSRRGPRESKTMYRLTRDGERRFRELLATVILDVQAEGPALETALVLLGQLRRDEAMELLAERAESVAAHERRLTRLLGDMRERVGSAYLSASHTLHRLRGERRYLSDAIGLLRNPKWEPAWVLNDGPIVDTSRKV